MPIDLDEQLRSIAQALVAEAPDVPTYRYRTVTKPSARRWLVPVAAVAIALAGAGALYLAAGGDDPVRSTESTVPPVVIGDVTWPAFLPLVDDAYGFVNAFPVDQFRVAQATLARRVDGALVDPVIVEVGTDYAATHNGAEPTDIVGVFGQTAHVYTSLDEVVPLAVVVGDDPYVAVAGVDPMAFLNHVDEDFVAPDVPADGGAITITFGDLPEGYEVIYNDGEPDHVTAFVSTMFNSPARQDEAVITGVGPAMIGRDATPTDVNGTAGWLSTDGAHSVVSWPVEGDTYTSVLADTPEAAAELARSLRFVSLDEWAQHQGIELDQIEPGPPVPF